MITILLVFIVLLFVVGLTVYNYSVYIMKKYTIYFICDSCGEKISIDKFDWKCHNCGSESFTAYF